MYYSEHSAKSLCYNNCYNIKQPACAFQLVCKHTEIKHAIFPELWVLQRFKTAKVTFSLTKGHWQSCHSKGHHDFVLIFHGNYVSILHQFLDIIDYFPQYKEVTW